MIWILSRSTSSCSLVRDCAGTPPESPTTRSILRPAIAPPCSFRYCSSARSMSMPPEASGPVLTVIRPRRIGALCALAGNTLRSGTAPAAWTNRLRLKLMSLLLQLVEELRVGHHPAQAALHVLQAELMQIVAVHARDAIGKHHHAVAEVERGERGIQHAGVGVDAHQHGGPDLQRVQQVL